MEIVLRIQVAECLSRPDLIALLEIVDLALRVNSSDELKEFWPRVAKFAKLEGAFFGVSKAQTREGFVQFDIVTCGIDPEWLGEYRNNQIVSQDPIVLAALESNRPISWKEAAKMAMRIDPEGFRNSIFRKHALASGLLHGYIYSERSRYMAQALSVTAVTTGSDAMNDRQCLVLNFLLPHLNEILVRQGFAGSGQLSERETEVLKWATAGKSNWELARILNISERTVKFHLRNIYRKLEVNNRSQAVAEAMRLGVTVME